MILGVWAEHAPPSRTEHAVLGTTATLPSSPSSRASCYAIIPDMMRLSRMTTQHGMVGGGMRLMLGLGPFNLFRLCLHAARKPLGVLKRNMNSLIPLLAMMDALTLRRKAPRMLFLHSQLTDLAVANDSPLLISRFLESFPEAGLMTRNLGKCVAFLERHSIPLPPLLAPFTSTGYAMRPDRVFCERFAKTHSLYGYTSCEKGDQEKEGRYLKKSGLKAAFLHVRP